MGANPAQGTVSAGLLEPDHVNRISVFLESTFPPFSVAIAWCGALCIASHMTDIGAAEREVECQQERKGQAVASPGPSV